MKLMIKKLSLFAFIGLLFLAIAGCTTTTTTVSELTDTEKVAAVLDGIDLGNLTAVTANLTLPTTVDGVTLSWSSANINVLSNAGAIVVPTYTTGDVTVVLTVTATLNDVTDSKTFSVTVSKETVSAFLTRAGNSIIINGADAVTGNLNLPATVLGATVTWESSNTEMVSIAATAVDGFYVATVTRPQADDGGVNTSAQLTATVSIDDQEIEVVKTILVLAESASTHVTSIAEGLSYALGTYITWEGMTILGVGTDGFYFTDGTDVMFVYNTAVAATVEEGEVYDVTGGISLYNSIPEVQNLGTNVVKVKASTVAARDITPVVATIDEIIANHTGYTAENPMEFGVYSVTAKVYYDQALGNYGTYLVLNDATGLDKAHAIRIYYKSNMTAVSALAGQTVTLDIVMFGYNSGASYLDWYAYFFGTTEDIEVTFANDQDAVDAAFNALTIPAAIIEGTTLDLPASLFGVTLTYASDNATVVNPTTGVVDLSSLTGQETVTLTVTGTRGSVTDSTTFEIVVGETPLSTIAEVLAMNTTTGLIAKVQGTVYAIYQTGYFIFDETGLFQVYTTPTGLSLGDEIVVSGTVAAYKSEVQFTYATVEETVSTGNDYAQTPELFIPGVTQLVAGQTYNTVGTVFWGKATETGYDNLYIKSAADTFMFQIYYKSVQTEYDALKAMAGQTVSLNFVYYNNKAATNPADISTIYSGGAVAATDADKVAADKEALEIETDQVSGAEATLPLVGTFGSVITWDVTAVTGATYDSVTGVLTYPTVTVDTDFTLTATITSGTTSDTLAITVSVRAVTDAEKLVEAQTALTIALTANEYDTVTLPTEGLNGVAIVWTISSGDAVLTDADLFFNMTGAAYDVTMLATLTLGTEADLTKEFTIAVSPITVITDLSLLTAKSGDPLVWTIANGTSVYVQGVVTGLVYDGLFIQDVNGNGFFMYHPVGTVEVGDEIVAKGTLADYRSARQLGNGGVIKTILTSENVVTSETLTLDQVIALTYADAGSVFTVTGLEVYSYTSSTVIFRVNGTSSVQYLRLYYNDWASWLDEVYPVGSFLPAVQFNMYNIYTTNIANPGDTFNIDNFLIEVTDEQLITVALASLTLPTAITEGTTLTLPASYAGVTFTYASDNEAVINSTTGVVDLSGLTTQVTVTLTVTATYGAGSDTATFAIKVGTIPLSTVAEAIALADDAVFRIQGILTAQTKSTAFWIEDATGGLNIYAATTDVQNQLIPLIGQEVELIGTKDSYNGLQEIVNITSVVVINATPTAIVPADISAVAFDSTGLLPYQGELVSFQGFILKYTVTATSGSVNFVLVNPVTGAEITARLESTLPTYADTLAQIKTFVAGDAIDVVGAVIGWYNGPQIAVVGASNFVAGTEITDQVMADYELTKVTLPTTPVTEDFTLDVAGVFGATVAWSSGDAAISITGAAATVTRPAVGQPDAVVTLTYTVTYDTATAQATIDITVLAVDEVGALAEAVAALPTTLYLRDFDMLPSLMNDATYTSVTVSSELVGVVSANTTLFASQRPAAGESSITGTATLNVALGSATNSAVVNIVVLPYASELYISEYIEGSGNNKALEIANDTGADVDLSTYVLEHYNNGATTATYDYSLSGTLVAGDVFVYYNSGADLAGLIAAGDDSEAYPCVAAYNGDDTIVFKNGTTIIDSIGQVGVDPGTKWSANGVETAEMTLVRKSNINSGDVDTSNVFDPSAEWVAYPQNNLDYIGWFKMAPFTTMVDDFVYADEEAFEAAWTLRVNGSNGLDPSTLLNLDSVHEALYFELPASANEGWFIARKYSTLASFGVTDDSIYLSFYLTNNTNVTSASVWLYWTGSQNAYTINLPAIGTSGWATVKITDSGHTATEIIDFGFAFNNWSSSPVTGSVTIEQIVGSEYRLG